MPAKSIKQQRLMGMVYALKTGALKLKDLPDSVADKIKSISKSITKSEAKKFAGTKHHGLPEKVKESFQFSFTDYLIFESVLTDEDLSNVQQIIERMCPKTGKRYEDEESSRPSAHLTTAEKSHIVKRAKRGEDIGAPGKKFKEIEKKAAKQYGSEEAGKRVAAAVMWKKMG
jgi:hypothetical protein